jgi:hypothetical protein
MPLAFEALNQGSRLAMLSGSERLDHPKEFRGTLCIFRALIAAWHTPLERLALRDWLTSRIAIVRGSPSRRQRLNTSFPHSTAGMTKTADEKGWPGLPSTSHAVPVIALAGGHQLSALCLRISLAVAPCVFSASVYNLPGAFCSITAPKLLFAIQDFNTHPVRTLLFELPVGVRNVPGREPAFCDLAKELS